jgi:hypothetical protein
VLKSIAALFVQVLAATKPPLQVPPSSTWKTPLVTDNEAIDSSYKQEESLPHAVAVVGLAVL